MAILHDLKVAVVVVPAAVARICLGFDVVAPVDLNERHPFLDEPAGQEARLAKARPAVALDNFGFLPAQIEDLGGRGRSQQREGLGAVFINGFRGTKQFGVPLQLIECLHQPLAIAEPLRGQLGRQLQ